MHTLGSCPNKVTRLDLALDVYVDAAPAIQLLKTRYPQECKLSRKAVKTRWIGSTRPDGMETGSFMIGDRRRSELTAIVYDKQNEALEKRGEELPPTIRYELRAKSGIKPTIVDALDPTPMFWNYAGGTLLKRPANISDWVQGRKLKPWVSSWVPKPPAEIMRHRVEESPELLALAKLAHRAGPEGLVMLQRLVVSRLESHYDRLRELELSEERSEPLPVIKPEPVGERRSKTLSGGEAAINPESTRHV